MVGLSKSRRLKKNEDEMQEMISSQGIAKGSTPLSAGAERQTLNC